MTASTSPSMASVPITIKVRGAGDRPAPLRRFLLRTHWPVRQRAGLFFWERARAFLPSLPPAFAAPRALLPICAGCGSRWGFPN